MRFVTVNTHLYMMTKVIARIIIVIGGLSQEIVHWIQFSMFLSGLSRPYMRNDTRVAERFGGRKRKRLEQQKNRE